jgi:hypothetical protein
MPEAKWVKQILTLQQPDGSWGKFHSLSSAAGQAMTTEQALRRLKILGLTREHPAIQKALTYLDRCLQGDQVIPDRREKVIDWDVFTSLMLATWLRVFCPQHPGALAVAKKWAEITESALLSKSFNRSAYEEAYINSFGKPPRDGRIIDFSSFYLVSLLTGLLTPKTEDAMLDHFLANPTGIYYIYPMPIHELPPVYASRQTSLYLGAVELLAQYNAGKTKLAFVSQWLNYCQDPDGIWDLGPQARDGIYFPLSDSWRREEYRRADCTRRISALLAKLS